MASLDITYYLITTCWNCTITALTAGWRPSYIAREQTTKKTRPSHCCLGTDPVENTAFPLLRIRLGSDHIENISRGICLATVVNKRFHCWLLTYSVHVTIFTTSTYFHKNLRRICKENNSHMSRKWSWNVGGPIWGKWILNAPINTRRRKALFNQTIKLTTVK
jgi:hypothetical protein